MEVSRVWRLSAAMHYFCMETWRSLLVGFMAENIAEGIKRFPAYKIVRQQNLIKLLNTVVIGIKYIIVSRYFGQSGDVLRQAASTQLKSQESAAKVLNLDTSLANEPTPCTPHSYSI
jgi:hypothetical protein